MLKYYKPIQLMLLHKKEKRFISLHLFLDTKPALHVSQKYSLTKAGWSVEEALISAVTISSKI
jgi:hypothetical protein